MRLNRQSRFVESQRTSGLARTWAAVLRWQTTLTKHLSQEAAALLPQALTCALSIWNVLKCCGVLKARLTGAVRWEAPSVSFPRGLNWINLGQNLVLLIPAREASAVTTP